MAYKKEKWFEGLKETGWHKTQSADTRRRNLMDTTDHRKDIHDRRVQAARRMNALANVTTDRETEAKARADANYFYRKARR